MLYIKEDTEYIRRYDLEPLCSPTIWLEIKSSRSKPFLLFIGYREWRCLHDKNKKLSRSIAKQLDRLENWNKSWEKAEEEGKVMLMMGDFNVDISPWLNPELISTSYQISHRSLLDKLKLMCSQNNMKVISTNSTRIQGNNKASMLDLILTNDSKLFSNPLTLDSSSDHKVMLIHKAQKWKTNAPMIKKARSYKKYTKKDMLENLDIPKINKLLWIMDPNVVANELVKEINNALNIVAPVKKIQTRRQYAPHLSENTKIEMKNRDQLKAKCYASKNNEDLKAYHKARNQCVSIQRKEKANWALKMLGNNPNDAKKTVENNKKYKW